MGGGGQGAQALHDCGCRGGSGVWSGGKPLGPLLWSVVQFVMQAAAHIPSEIRDAPRPTEYGYFDSAGEGGLPKLRRSTQKLCSSFNSMWGLKSVWL